MGSISNKHKKNLSLLFLYVPYVLASATRIIIILMIMIFSSGQPFEHESVMSAFQRHSEKQFPIHRDRRHKHNMTRMVTDIIMAVPIVRGTQSSSGEKEHFTVRNIKMQSYQYFVIHCLPPPCSQQEEDKKIQHMKRTTVDRICISTRSRQSWQVASNRVMAGLTLWPRRR